jgi:hypothetical protein
MKHTPGPWVYQEHTTGTIEIHNQDSTIGTVAQLNPRGPEDARLIAAAPELLRACEYAVLALGEGIGKHHELTIAEIHNILNNLIGAITKATTS